MSVERIEELKRKLAARSGKKEYAKNCEALRAAIARLEGKPAVASQVEDGTA